MNARLAAAAIVTVSALAGCGSMSGTYAASSPSAALRAADSRMACTTDKCIASEAEYQVKGSVAKDEAVVTKASCQPSTVKNDGGGNYTVTCDLTYSDGQQISGYVNLLPSQSKVTFEPAGQ
jgi:hypothetical protein